ncbi:phage portal protein [uncultured Enterovirga sp.]|uniref:phage portal protein n=1 Tax=uncultured Enterovirga sp. TaxID=2026352 RepID=UPI0035C9E91F
MGILDLLFRRSPEASSSSRIHANAGAFLSFDDPRLVEYLRSGTATTSGVSVSVESAMRNPAVFRSLSLISQTIGMLPLHLLEKNTKEKARDHPLFRVLHRKPNDYQSAYDFRVLMQLRALVKGNAYALIVRGARREVLSLVPLNPDRVTPIQGSDWRVSYRYEPGGGGHQTFAPEEILHIRNMPDMGSNGVLGVSLVRQAADAIGLALAQDLAVSRLFKNGSFVPLALSTKDKLSDIAIKRLKDSWASGYAGADNAGKMPILEEGLSPVAIASTAKDAQTIELRKHQIEEIARVLGVPRPLLMMDDTSWGSGIGVLGQFFVRYGLNPWFDAWQQAIERSLLTDAEADRFEVKFNAGVLLRGSMAEQGDFLAKALGAGGHQPWMHADEARDFMDLPVRDIPPNTMLGHNGGPPLKDGA